MKALLAGWFSFEEMGATAGDLMVRDAVADWLAEEGISFDVAVAHPFTGGVDWSRVEPADYTHVVFVCGPFGNGPPVDGFLERFSGRILIGLDLTMLDPLEVWNPFDLLIERDSSAAQRPDLSLLRDQGRVPVVGLVLIHPQPEYGDRDLHRVANQALEDLLAKREAATVRIDTRLDHNGTGLRSAREVESLIAKMDLVLTTRLHGLVLGIKNGVPVLAIDPVAGGGKIRRQGESLRWPHVYPADGIDADQILVAFDSCTRPSIRTSVRASQDWARSQLLEVRGRFIREFRAGRAER